MSKYCIKIEFKYIELKQFEFQKTVLLILSECGFPFRSTTCD